MVHWRIAWIKAVEGLFPSQDGYVKGAKLLRSAQTVAISCAAAVAYEDGSFPNTVVLVEVLVAGTRAYGLMSTGKLLTSCPIEFSHL